MHPGDRHYRSAVVRPSDLTVTTDVIENVTFENCTVQGPAVLVPLEGVNILQSRWDGDLSAIIWPIPPSRDRVIGVVGVRNVTFTGCRFERVGLAVPEAQVDEVVRGFDGG
jgi:hypothetical protein